jgi:hypothetical protein
MKFKTVALLIGLGLLASPVSAKNDRDEHRYEKKHEYEKRYKEEKRYKYQSLNKGMQKKLVRTGELPPGWQKKIIPGETLDREVYIQSRIVKGLNARGEVTIEIDNRLIRLHQATMEIIDVFNSPKQRD